MKHRLRDLLACNSCGRFQLDLVELETVSAPLPADSGTRCSLYRSRLSKPVGEASGRIPPYVECYGAEITQGILRCDDCRKEFPIIDGVPRFNPDVERDYPGFFRRYGHQFRYRRLSDSEFQSVHSETKRSFGFQRLRFRVTDHDENRAHFYSRTGTVPGSLGKQLFFEAGCGMGRYLKVVADEAPAEVVGVDLSLAVNRAYEENRQNPFVHVVQGDIFRLPFRPNSFDHVSSIGVLHHIPSTQRAFRRIVRLVKPTRLPVDRISGFRYAKGVWRVNTSAPVLPLSVWTGRPGVGPAVSSDRSR